MHWKRFKIGSEWTCPCLVLSYLVLSYPVLSSFQDHTLRACPGQAHRIYPESVLPKLFWASPKRTRETKDKSFQRGYFWQLTLPIKTCTPKMGFVIAK
jgi:hypothetical protein